jgi:branched-chain amino acid aminotransferase
MNIFVVRGDQLITPDVNQDILEGITRRSLIELARNAGLTVVERSVDKSELLVADEVFLSGTAARVTPVTQIEQYMLPAERPITQQLTERFKKASAGEDPQFPDWMVSLPAIAKKA